ncbi:MAG: hypothetical protein ACRD18_05180 [Terriglobia bacterium]
MQNKFVSMALLLALFCAVAAPVRAGPSLPDVTALLKQVQKNQARVEMDREKYTFTDIEEQDDVSRTGALKNIAQKQYDVFFLHGHLIRRLVKKNGKPLSASAQKKEDARVAKLVEKYERKAAKKDHSDDSQVGITVFLRTSLFTHPRWEELRGRKVLAFDFYPSPAYKPRTKAERICHDLDGVAWVDPQAQEVVRLQAGFDGSFKIAGGLLASVEKGTTVTLEQTFVDGDVWLPSYDAFNANLRLLLFKGLRLNFVNRYSGYRVFDVRSLSKITSPGKAKL